MRRELHDIALIEKYLQNELTVDESAQVQRKIDEDEDFKAAVLLQKTVVGGLTYFGLESEIASAHRNYMAGKGMGAHWKWILSGVIGTILLTSAIWLSSLPKEQNEKALYQMSNAPVKNHDFTFAFNDTDDWKFRRSSIKKEFSENNVQYFESRAKNDELDSASIPKKAPFSTFKPEEQDIEFIINNTRDTILSGLNGMEFNVPAGIFISNKPESIKLKVTKYDKYSEMVLANLSTQTKNLQPLETAGMINISASDNSGKVELKEGKKIGLYFPQSEGKYDWKLFDGVHDNEYTRWDEQENKPDNFSTYKISYSIDEEPKFPGGDSELYKFLSRNITFPEAAIEEGVGGSVYISFIINEDGYLLNPKVVKGIGYGCDEAALSAFYKMPKWIPGKYDSVTISSQVFFPINFKNPNIPSKPEKNLPVGLDPFGLQKKESPTGPSIKYSIYNGQIPTFDGLKEYLDSALIYPKNRKLKKHGGQVNARLFIDENGVVRGMRINSSSHDEFSNSVYNAVKQMNGWKPVRRNNINVVSAIDLPFFFDGDNTDEQTLTEVYEDISCECFYPIGDTLKFEGWEDYANGKGFKDYKDFAMTQNAKSFLWSSGLNMINCDRFIGKLKRLHNIKVLGNEEKELCYLLFEKINSAMAISGNQFINIPNNYQVKIVSFYVENGVYMVRSKEVNSSINSINLPEAKAMTKEEFIQLLDGTKPEL